MTGSKLLLEEHPLLVLPRLACVVGLNEAIVLQQLNYWTHTSKNVHEGHRWVYNTLGEWKKQFPFWSESTIKRTMASLRERGLVVIGQSPQRSTDRTNWYRIDFEALDRLADEAEVPSGQVDPMEEVKVTPSSGSDRPDASGQIDLLLKTETSPETSTREGAAKSSDSRPCPVKVGKDKVTPAECELAWGVMDAFNQTFGTTVRAKGFVEKIIRRHREHPELALEDHVRILKAVKGGRKWWSGTPDPAIIYGNDEQFERSMANAPSAGGANPSGSSVQSEGVQTDEDESGWGNLDDRVRYD